MQKFEQQCEIYSVNYKLKQNFFYYIFYKLCTYDGVKNKDYLRVMDKHTLKKDGCFINVQSYI